MQKEDVLAYLKDIKSDMVQNGIEKIGLFGSLAKGKSDSYSDIDIVIKTTPTFVEKHNGIYGFLFLEDLRTAIAKRFHRDVDICDETGLKNRTVLEGAIYA